MLLACTETGDREAVVVTGVVDISGQVQRFEVN
jgi:hypothetical protein